jgi:NADH:ubiquinone oxidoreductase subunit 2 (subunit N)
MTICLPSMQEWGAIFQADQAAVQLTFSAYVVAYGGLQLVYGPLSDRHGRKNVLLVGLALAGIPPTVGFYAKLAVLQSVVDAGMVWLAIAAVLLSLIGAFYYLRIVKTVYFDEPSDTAVIAPSADARAVMAVNGALVLLLGIVPGPLMALCYDAVKQALGG